MIEDILQIVFGFLFTGNAMLALVFRFGKNPDIPKANFHAILCILILLISKP
jgi:hypothetical protein